MNLLSTEKLTPATKSEPCRHCGKPDWCYRVGNLDVCNREVEPAQGWVKTTKTDAEGKFFYARIEHKPVRPRDFRCWEYPARDGSKLVRVCRVDDGQGKKTIWQEHWNGNEWIKGTKEIDKSLIPIYRYAEIREAIEQGKPIYIVEGETCADILWKLGIPATTNIGGAGKWLPNHADDLEGATAIVLCPDGDKPGIEHMLKVAETLPNEKVKWLLAFPDSPRWESPPKSGGLDVVDWIADYKLGVEDIKKAVMDAEAFRAKLLKQFPGNQVEEEGRERKKKKAPTPPPPNAIADKIAELYRDKLAWESEYQLWRRYGAKHDGMWSEESVESVRGIIHAYLRSRPDAPPFNAGLVSSVLTILQSDLEVKDWDEQPGLIPLRDGVLNQETLELEPHSSGHRFTWQLPFKWADRDIGCEPIEEFLLRISSNPQIAEVLLCFLSAVVTRRSDLQRYLELIGGGGTGKSTYMALAKALAGEENTVSSRLSLLEKNQFETAKFYRKILALFPDSERWQGEVSVLKQLTGQDPIRYERKGVQQCKDFRYEGMVILSANEPPESSDRTSGQERRKLTIGLDNRIPEYEGRNLIEEFKPYLPGLLKRVLEIPRERVTQLVKHTDKYCPALADKKRSQLIETNPIAAWVDENCVIAVNTKGYIGNNNEEMAGKWLYANFCKYQRESGHKNSVPLKRFSANLRDLLKYQLKASIFEGRDRNGAYIEGIGLRCYYDPNGSSEPRPITGIGVKHLCDNKCNDNAISQQFNNKGQNVNNSNAIYDKSVTDDGGMTVEALTSEEIQGNDDLSPNCNESAMCDGFVMDGDGSVTAETLGSVGCDGCDGFHATLQENQKNEESEFLLNRSDSEQGNGEQNPSHPSQVDLVTVSSVTLPSPHPSQPKKAPQGNNSLWTTEETVADVAGYLESCDNKKLFSDLQGTFRSDAIIRATERLSPEKQEQLKQWSKEIRFDSVPNDIKQLYASLVICYNKKDFVTVLKGQAPSHESGINRKLDRIEGCFSYFSVDERNQFNRWWDIQTKYEVIDCWREIINANLEAF